MINNCTDAILPEVEYTLKPIQERFVSKGAKMESLSEDTMLKTTDREIKKSKTTPDQSGRPYARHDRLKNKQAIKGKSAEEIWAALKAKVQDFLACWSLRVITAATLIKISDFTDAALYCNEFKLS